MPNPNPSPETRFKPGQSGNPGGKSAEHVAAERKAAEISALMRLQVLSTMQEKVSKITEMPDASLDDILKLLDGDVLRLFKDSEDRAHGTPKQSVEHGGEGGGPILFRTVYESE
jgi:hypothetical protein